MSVEGLDLDATIDVLGQFGAYDQLEVGVRRLVERNLVTIDVCGPDGVSYTKLKVPTPTLTPTLTLTLTLTLTPTLTLSLTLTLTPTLTLTLTIAMPSTNP